MTPMKARTPSTPSTPAGPTGPTAGPRVSGGRRRVAGARRRPEADRVIVLPDDPAGSPGSPAELSPAELLTPAGLDTPAGLAPPAALAPPAEPTQPTSGPTTRTEPEILSSSDDPGPDDETAPVVRRRRALVPAVLSACLVAVLAACLLAAVTTRQDRSDAAAGPAAVAAARISAAKILSYDYRHLSADFAAASALTTGSFRTDYQATTTKAVSQLATQTKAVVSAQVAAAGVISSSRDRVSVLLFVNQTTTSNRLSAAKVDQVRVQLTMAKVHGRWLVSALTAL